MPSKVNRGSFRLGEFTQLDSSSAAHGAGMRSSITKVGVMAESPAADQEAETPYVRRLESDPKQERHYVLVIHGTFDSPPKSGPKPWYLKDLNPGNFCFILASDLRDTHMGFDAIWRSLPDDRTSMNLPRSVPYPFHWDGANTHYSRRQAGKRLGKLINAIGKADPKARIHLIAHSHGGNVLLKGVSSYLSTLRRECRSPYNKEITDEFWRAHKQSYEAIAKHQKVCGVAWHTRFLGLFAIVRRPWGQEEELGGFLWGYWEFTDRLLGLPKYRQNKYLRKKWASSSSTNALGHLVFLGTPFYTKTWQHHAYVSMALNIIITSAIMFCTIVGVVTLVKFIRTHSVDDANVTTLEVTFYWILALASLGFVAFTSLMGKRFKEGNLYHNETRAWSPAMHALVLNAGKLDEAALALSTEPLVRAYLFPQIKTMLTPDPWKNLRPFPMPEFQQSIYNGYQNAILVIWNIIFAVPYLLLLLLNFVLVPYFCNALLRLCISLGFGLQKGELDYARVYVEEYLRLDPANHSISHWNVQKILTAAANEQLQELVSQGGGETPDEVKAAVSAQKELEPTDEAAFVAERWRFLWDNEELDRRAQNSITMGQLRGEMLHMPHNPRATRFAFEREIKLICVTLEERYKDMAGNVELSHGSYFRNRAVIAAITYFLLHGRLPAWADKVGDVKLPDQSIDGDV